MLNALIPAGSHREFLWNRLGLMVWLALIVVVVVLVLRNPEVRSVVPAYRLGSENFFSSLPLYDLDALHGYLWTPSYAVLYSPFWLLGVPLGDVVWRLFGFSVLIWAAISQTRHIADDNRIWVLSCALFIALPICAGTLRNGQATILLTGATWLAILAAVRGETWRLFFWATLALIAKPLAIVAVLLIGGIYPKRIPILIASVVVVLALPFAFGPADYVIGEYSTFIELMRRMSLELSAKFTPADFTALFSAIGIDLSDRVVTLIRFVMALATFCAALLLHRRLPAGQFSLWLTVLATYYMSMFNPRVEGNTYALLAIPFALSVALVIRSPAHRWLGVLFAVVMVVTGLNAVEPTVFGFTKYWFKPAMMTLVLGGLLSMLFADPPVAGLTQVSGGDRKPAMPVEP